jgi:hypothetical protein
LKEGDRNSRFFHVSTLVRRRRNHIEAIKSDQGDWLREWSEISQDFNTNFQDLYSEESATFPEDLDGLVQNCITDQENEQICRIPTREEIKTTIFEMHPCKAPGPDGLPAFFFKQYWPIVADQVCNAVQNFFVHGQMLKELNNTFIVLIPKNENPTTVNHYRPISLCNTVYKIISKLLVARLRPILHKLISPQQSAFILGRWIIENLVMVQELMHNFKTNSKLAW